MAARRLLIPLIVTMAILGCTSSTAVPASVASASPPAVPSPTPPPGPTGSPRAAAVLPASPPASPASAAVATGPFSLDLYRRGIYAMQATWWWCTAATIEMLRNISLHQADHSAADQERYFDYSHAHDSYVMPADEGVDLVGLQAGLGPTPWDHRFVIYTA